MKRHMFQVFVLLWIARVDAGESLVPVKLNSGFGDLYLLAQQAVQDDLRLSPAQLEQVHDLVAQVVAKQEEYALTKDPARRQTLVREMTEATIANGNRAAALLNPSQAQRLSQISLHHRGMASFYDAQVQKQLSLTTEQIAKMRSPRRLIQPGTARPKPSSARTRTSRRTRASWQNTAGVATRNSWPC